LSGNGSQQRPLLPRRNQLATVSLLIHGSKCLHILDFDTKLAGCFSYIVSGAPSRKYRLQQFIYCGRYLETAVTSSSTISVFQLPCHWILQKYVRSLWAGFMEGFCERGNEPSNSIQCWEYLEKPNNYQLLKKYSAPWNWLSGHVIYSTIAFSAVDTFLQ
jgi:hypothetical protein